MASKKQINQLVRIAILTLSLMLSAGVENYAVAGKKPVKTNIENKKKVPTVTNPKNNDIPKPVVDDTPINPKKPKTDSAGQNKNDPTKKPANSNPVPKKNPKKKM